LPVTSTIVYNTRYFTPDPDLALQEHFYNVVLHEIGHSLGYRYSMMQTFATTEKPHDEMQTDSWFDTYYYYVGENGVREFNAIFGDDMPFTANGTRFLMETITSTGSFGSHLSEVYATYFNSFGDDQTELMNWQTLLSGIGVSAVTIGILNDLGYSVDYAMADPMGSVAPINLTASVVSGGGVELAWDMPGGSTTSYEVYRKNAAAVGDAWVSVGTTASQTFIDESAAAGQYQYHIVAMETANVVSDVGVYWFGSGETLSWAAVPGASEYTIYRLEVSTKGYANQLSWETGPTISDTSYTFVEPLDYATYYHIVAHGLFDDEWFGLSEQQKEADLWNNVFEEDLLLPGVVI